jgi:hypothetical protein
MPKIRISQKREWSARFRVLDLYLDGEILGYVPNGETIEFDVPVGQHTLKAKMGFFSSKVLNFTMFNKEIKSFTISPKVINHFLLPFIILGMIILQFYAKRIFKSEHTDLIVFSLFLLLSVYSFTIGRNHYLKIKEG